jgi:2-dehydro-3-deoxy-D-gluconate 5-dehydrogenase
MFDLTGKTAIITGASRGIGASMAIGLAAAGASVLLVSRSAPDSDVIAALQGKPTAHLAADLTRMDAIPQVVQAARDHFGRVDILINNVGMIRRTPFLDHTEADYDAVLALNLKIPIFLAQACARQMVAQGSGGKIINVCSLLSHQGGILVLGYTAAKHGLAGVTKLMANELAQHRINVNGIAPGYIRTENTAALQADNARSNAILARIPQGRWGESDDLVGAAVFLSSAASDYVNGHILTVDGGWMGR